MEYTIDITSYCQHDCEYCSTNATIDGTPLPIEKIIDFVSDIKKEDTINLSGGEPLSHPDFWKILQHCKTKTNNVWIYTNAINQIRYNTDVLPEIKVEANVCLIPGKKIYIPGNADRVHLLKLVPQGRAKNMGPVNITLSGEDCTKCTHKVLQADGIIVDAPCKKKYL